MGFVGDILGSPMKAIGGIMGGGGGGSSGGGGGMLGGLLGGGGGGGLGGMLGGLPIVGGMLGGGGQQQGGGGMGAAMGQTPGQSPNFPGYGPGAFPGWPVPPPMSTPQAPKFEGDLSKPGAAESYFDQNQGKWGQAGPGSGFAKNAAGSLSGPGTGNDYWGGVAGKFQSPQGTAQNAQGAYDDFKSSAPPNMAAYYDNAVTNANKDINNQFGARGLYNSSAATNALGTADANLRAQQAKDEAQYGLSRSQLGGNLAGAADTSSRGASQDMLSWLGTGGGLANQLQGLGIQGAMGMGNLGLGMDQSYLNAINSGMGAANAAQNALRTRGQDYFSNNFGLAQQNANNMSNIYGHALGNDQNIQEQQIAAMLGLNQGNLNQSLNGRASQEEGIGNLAGLMGKVMGGMMGGI